MELIQEGVLQANAEMEPAYHVMSYPGKMASIRAFIFACVSGDTNTNMFGPHEFVAGCSRFSLENPVPSVSHRCALYGNPKEIMEKLVEAESNFAKANSKFDSKLYTAMNMGLPEKKEKPKHGNIFGRFEEEKGSDDEEVIDSKRKPTIAVNETPRATLKTEAVVSLKDLKF